MAFGVLGLRPLEFYAMTPAEYTHMVNGWERLRDDNLRIAAVAVAQMIVHRVKFRGGLAKKIFEAFKGTKTKAPVRVERAPGAEATGHGVLGRLKSMAKRYNARKEVERMQPGGD